MMYKYYLLYSTTIFLSLHIAFAQEAKHLGGRKYLLNTQNVEEGLNAYTFSADSTDGPPLAIYMLEVDLHAYHLDIALASDQVIGQETVSSLAARKGAVAAINGGFFTSTNPRALYYGDPSDLMIIDGRLISEPTRGRSSFGICELLDGTQKPFVEQLNLQYYLHRAEDSLRIDGINRKRDSADILIYTPEFNFSTLNGQQGKEILVQHNRVTQIKEGALDGPIPANSFIISVDPNASPRLSQLRLKVGDSVVVKSKFTSSRCSQTVKSVKNCSYVTAGPTLIYDAKPVTDFKAEFISESFEQNRHPRTAIGISKDRKKLWLIVVDGRQPGYSMGMSLGELRSFLLELGAYEAYNLDGGGSSTLVLNNELMNSPSDRQERMCSDALLLFKNR